MGRAFRDHKLLLIVTACYMAAVTVAVFACEADAGRFFYIIAFYGVASSLYLFCLLGVFLFLLVKALLKTKRQGGPVRYLTASVKTFETSFDDYVRGGMLANAFAGLVVVLPLLTFFSMGKSLLGHAVAYRWDPVFAAADRLLHFGRYPHEWLNPFLETLHLVPFVDDAYLAWFGAMFAANGFCLFLDRDRTRRMRYLWAFVLCWILSGTVAAFMFASSGPVFFGMFHPDLVDPYASLTAWLATARDGQPVDTMKVAGFLHDMTTDGVLPDLNGISAMPSQHVAVAWLIALYARSCNRYVGWLAFAYAFLIMIGSVVLGWHYAIDGYAGILCAWLVWLLAGWIVAWTNRTESV